MTSRREEIVDRLQVKESVSGGGIESLRRAVRVAMTAAASGSNGIQVADNANADFGIGNFTLHWEGALPDYTPSADQFIFYKRLDDNNIYTVRLQAAGTLRLRILVSAAVLLDATSTVAIPNADASSIKISIAVVRETASAAGSVTFYVNGVQLGAVVAIAAGTPLTYTNTGILYLLGREIARTASDTQQAIIYNRALSAAEVLSLSVNGAALADLGASQVAVYTSNFSAGTDSWVGNWYGAGTTVTGNIDGINGSDDWLRVEKTGAGSFPLNTYREFSNAQLWPNQLRNPRGLFRVFNPVGSGITGFRVSAGLGDSSGQAITLCAEGSEIVISVNQALTSATSVRRIMIESSGNLTGTGQIFYVKDVTLFATGITGQWNAEDAQSDTGQIFDRSGNKNHALLPAAGATIIGRPTAQPQQVRWTNTWAGTNELQYIGGVNQAILPAKAYIESIVGVITGATVEDIIIGDGSDTDRYVTITTGLAAGTVTFTLANRTTDGTNLKLTVDPDANATMSIAWTITYRTLE